jgi:hypothetical protein
MDVEPAQTALQLMTFFGELGRSPKASCPPLSHGMPRGIQDHKYTNGIRDALIAFYLFKIISVKPSSLHDAFSAAPPKDPNSLLHQLYLDIREIFLLRLPSSLGKSNEKVEESLKA